MTQITVNLPDEVMRRAELLARHVGLPVAEVLAEAIELSLNPVGLTANGADDLAALPDGELVAATNVELPAEADRRLSELLDRQQAGLLTAPERAELIALMSLYQEKLLRKACALREAVRRGLRGPLEA